MNHPNSFDLITIGGATWDAIISADDAAVVESAGRKYLGYPYGEKVHMEDTYFGFGGGAANVAVSAARLGLKTSFVGAIGTAHVAESILENFRTNQVNVDFIKRDTEHRTGLSIVLTAPDGERTILLYRGANNHLTDADIDWQHCVDTDWLYVSSLSGESDKLFTKAAEAARKAGVKLALNPGATQIKRGTKGLHVALTDAAVILLNEDEARELLRQHGQAGEDVAEMLKALQDINHGIAVITQGTAGVQVYDGQNLYQMKAWDTARVNTLGAGDAFGSTFVSALAKGKQTGEAIRYASLNAAAVVADYGAQSSLLDWDELNQRAAAPNAAKWQPTVTPL